MDTAPRSFGDLSEEFLFDEASMDYLDGPLSGWLQSKATGEWFAFDCQPIIAGQLWHWTLVPVKEKSDDLMSVLKEATNMDSGYWLSIIEDRRLSATSESRLAKIENATARPVLFSAWARHPAERSEF